MLRGGIRDLGFALEFALNVFLLPDVQNESKGEVSMGIPF